MIKVSRIPDRLCIHIVCWSILCMSALNSWKSSILFFFFSVFCLSSLCFVWIWGYKQEKGENLGLAFMICDGGKGTCLKSETKEKE